MKTKPTKSTAKKPASRKTGKVKAKKAA